MYVMMEVEKSCGLLSASKKPGVLRPRTQDPGELVVQVPV